MIKKAAFYDFFNRRSGCDFDQFISESVEDEDYIQLERLRASHALRRCGIRIQRVTARLRDI